MHLSTSFKYMCSAMAALAYQGAAQLTDDTWKIAYQGSPTVDFTQDNLLEEISMTYHIGHDKIPIVALFDGDCTDLAAGDSPTALTVGASNVVADTDITTITQNSPTADLDTRTLKINIDKTLIDGSTIWNTGTSKLQFCVELRLEESGEVITQDLQALDIDFDFDVSFAETGQDVDTAVFAATQDSENAVTGAADVDDYISAYKCTGTAGTLSLDATALANDDILQVCITSDLGDTVAIQKVKSLVLTQAGTSPDFSVMNADLGGTVANTALSTIANDNEETILNTIVPARFFDSSNNIAVSGVVEVDFATGGVVTRRLVAFGNNRLGSNDRKMIEAPFEDADLPQETTDAKFNFDVPVEKAPTEDQFVDMNSGSTISAAAGALAAVAVSYLW